MILGGHTYGSSPYGDHAIGGATENAEHGRIYGYMGIYRDI